MFEPQNLERWQMPSHYAGETWPDYYNAGVGQSRDSDCLERSNFASMLKAIGGESETVIVVRESHWAVGWIEWIAIHESDESALFWADHTMAEFADYPVIDEEDLSEREMEEANEIWRECYNAFERIAYIREHRYQFEFNSFADMMGCIRGEYFAGYASELIS